MFGFKKKKEEVKKSITVQPTIKKTMADAKFVMREMLKENAKLIILAGPFCCGKSTVGSYISDHFGFDFIDLDDFANRHVQISDDFREKEAIALRKVVKIKRPTIIALGGGTLLREDNYRAIEGLHVIFFGFSFDKIASNLKMEGELEKRKFLPQDMDNPDDLAKIKEMYNDRMKVRKILAKRPNTYLI